jgi:hypothetical protein
MVPNLIMVVLLVASVMLNRSGQSGISEGLWSRQTLVHVPQPLPLYVVLRDGGQQPISLGRPDLGA